MKREKANRDGILLSPGQQEPPGKIKRVTFEELVKLPIDRLKLETKDNIKYAYYQEQGKWVRLQLIE